MANISDVSGVITVEKIGKEFLDFLKVVQDDAYYKLVDGELEYVPDDDGDLELDFYSMGRWHFGSNLQGYLGGEWMSGEKESTAHEKLLRALKRKKGHICVEYFDSDTAMDWMGQGMYEMFYEDGELVQNDSFDEERITLERFAEVNGESKEWALEYIYGDEVLESWHTYKEKGGKKDIEYWFDNIYEEE